MPIKLKKIIVIIKIKGKLLFLIKLCITPVFFCTCSFDKDKTYKFMALRKRHGIFLKSTKLAESMNKENDAIKMLNPYGSTKKQWS
ncbi:MAG: hypothetical protein B7C24_07875 [Bacteroidetes bacterium 4572_77]|nr:MAG: hypothetical protein B7C24_07875 [Bacteroidetes bacterium 4572_77]